MLWLFCSSLQTTKTLSLSAVRLSRFLLTRAHWRSPFFSFKNFLRIHELAESSVQEASLSAHLSFQHIFLTKLNHFQLLVARGVRLFLSLEHLGALQGYQLA